MASRSSPPRSSAWRACAFRFAGSGTLGIAAHRVGAPAGASEHKDWMGAPPTEPARPVPRPAPRARAPDHRDRRHRARRISSTAVDISSDVLRTMPRAAEADLAYQSAQTLIAAAGGNVESDDATFSTRALGRPPCASESLAPRPAP